MTRLPRMKLPYQGTFDTHAALALLSAHTIPGTERTDVTARRHTRLFPDRDGVVTVSVEFGTEHIHVSMDAEHSRVDADRIRAEVRWWLDLDTDLTQVSTTLGVDPMLGPLIAARPGLRVIGHPDVAEAAVTTVLGQQVSVARGAAFAARLAAAYGEPGPSGLIRFPRPATLARADVDELRARVGLTMARARTVIEVGRAFADGVGVTRHTDPAEARRLLLAIPGVGPWTVEYLGVRALGDRDAFPAGDLVLRRALGVETIAEATAASSAWSPLRAYAAVHLWTVAAYAPADTTAT